MGVQRRRADERVRAPARLAAEPRELVPNSAELRDLVGPQRARRRLPSGRRRKRTNERTNDDSRRDASDEKKTKEEKHDSRRAASEEKKTHERKRRFATDERRFGTPRERDARSTGLWGCRDARGGGGGGGVGRTVRQKAETQSAIDFSRDNGRRQVLGVRASFAFLLARLEC